MWSRAVLELSRVGAIALLCAAGGFPMVAGGAAVASDISHGSLVCSIEGESESADATQGPTYLVLCSFHADNSGATAQYAGSLSLQREADRNRRSFIWIVRGAAAFDLGPADLAQSYTARGTVTAGTIAPLVPKSDEDTVSLFTFGEPLARAGGMAHARAPRSDPVATLDLRLLAAPT